MSVTINTKGIIFLYDSKPISAVRMNPAVKRPLESACKELTEWGYIGIDTLGITNNRQMRSGRGTSRHAEGLASNDYKIWSDGSHGSLAFDLVDISHKSGLKSKRISDPDDRFWLIAFFRKHGFEVYHTGEKGDRKVKPDHLHIEWRVRL